MTVELAFRQASQRVYQALNSDKVGSFDYRLDENDQNLFQQAPFYYALEQGGIA